uniref:C2H2-type domain-containing protein n=1 Tax=Hucho hucho TaxID=62062 RepID=A0A4W5P838_9TELE
ISKLQSFREFLNERLPEAALEIVSAVEKTVAEYQEENDRLRGLLRITPKIQLWRIGSYVLSLAVSEEDVPFEQQHCEQEWSTRLGQEDPEPIQIKEEQEELWTSQEKEKLQGMEVDIIEFKCTPPCVKSECDQEDPLQSLTLLETQTVENGESDSKPVDLKPFGNATHLNNQNNDSSHTTSKTTLCCRDLEKPYPVCGKTFKYKGHLTNHIRTHTGEKTFSCGDCGKSFIQKGHLTEHIRHMLTHTREKPFSCGDCGKSFSYKGDLSRHMLTHTREKPFSCGDCGKSFSYKGDLSRHMLTHTRVKPFSYGDCGKSFYQKGHLNEHIWTHTGEKQHVCSVCSKGFTQKAHLVRHVNNVHKERKQDEKQEIRKQIRRKIFCQKMGIKRQDVDRTTLLVKHKEKQNKCRFQICCRFQTYCRF